MRVFLRHIQTGHYYNGNCEWVVQAPDANDFGSIDNAINIVADEKLDGMSIVILHDRSGREQVFDLTETSRMEQLRRELELIDQGNDD